MSKVKKVWTLVQASGRDIGGSFTGSPAAAAKKAAASAFAHPRLPKGTAGSTTVYLRQVSLGRGHNQIKCYKVSQVMVKPPPNAPEWLVRGRSKIPQKNAKEVMCPPRLRNLNN